MHLLDNVTTEVYKAYFPRSISSSAAVDLAAPDKGSEHNYKKWPPQEKSPFFPADQICAEDPDWDKSDNCPPSLAARCIQTLARFFSVKPERSDGLKGGDRAKFLNLLSTNEPILLTAEKISDELYWKRCCIDHLISYDNSKHGGSYKRLFLEKHLQYCIEAFVPQQTDLFDIKDLLGVMEPFIKRLEITELLPPELLLYPGREDENLDDDDGDLDISQATNSAENTLVTGSFNEMASLSRIGGPPLPAEINMKVPANHFDFGAIFPQLSGLEEFHVCFKVKSCGIDFRWNMFGITSKDADNLGAGLKICKKLRVLRIYNSKLDDDKMFSIYDGIKTLTHIEEVNFQNNQLSDESAETMSKLLSGTNPIKRLDLTNNKLSDKVARTIADFLKSPQSKGRLEKLNLSLNSIKDEGCKALAEAISNHSTLHTLDLSSNYVTKASGEPLKSMIIKSPALKNLFLSCNPLKVEGCIKILEGVQTSSKIMKADIRLTGCSRDVDLAIQQALKKNRFAVKKGPSFSSSSRSSSPSGHSSSTTKKYPYPKI